jgi:hypothetical protein
VTGLRTGASFLFEAQPEAVMRFFQDLFVGLITPAKKDRAIPAHGMLPGQAASEDKNPAEKHRDNFNVRFFQNLHPPTYAQAILGKL